MKIAIDARKWRDYGIGTYVRNLVRHLAHLDRETTYFLFCDRADQATLRDLAENFVPIVDGSSGYGIQEHVSIEPITADSIIIGQKLRLTKQASGWKVAALDIGE